MRLPVRAPTDAGETKAADAPHPDTEAYAVAGSETPLDGAGAEEPAGDTDPASEESSEEPPAKASAGG